jgi:hypothetical protein
MVYTAGDYPMRIGHIAGGNKRYLAEMGPDCSLGYFPTLTSAKLAIAGRSAHNIECDSGETWAYRVRLESSKGEGDPIGFAQTMEGADKTAQRLADSYGEPVVVFPCLRCRALIPLNTVRPSA